MLGESGRGGATGWDVSVNNKHSKYMYVCNSEISNKTSANTHSFSISPPVRLCGALLMSTHNICFYGEIRNKTFIQLFLLSRGM